MIANGVNGGNNVWTANKASNADRFSHVVAYTQPGTSYLLIGFEDLYGGGDKDYNDALIVVDIGAANVARLTGSPEPSSVLTAGILSTIGAWYARRRKNGQHNNQHA